MSAYSKTCGCKGIRTCLLCEEATGKTNLLQESLNSKETWRFCPYCGSALKSQDHSEHDSDSDRLQVEGVYIYEEFLNEEQEEAIVAGIDNSDWVSSQSGRRKQDYGPKVNFKKRKLNIDAFQGFPTYTSVIFEKLKNLPILKSFQPIELCNLEYVPERGSAIDPHFDDFWLWGERLVTVNLLSDTSYNLTQTGSNVSIIVPVPRRSVVVLAGDARYKWMHSVKRDDITQRRIGITIRELTPEFLDGGENSQLGQKLLDKAIINNEL